MNIKQLDYDLDRILETSRRGIGAELVKGRRRVILAHMHAQVATLLGSVRALRALEARLFATALHHLMPAEGALPPVLLLARRAAVQLLIIVDPIFAFI